MPAEFDLDAYLERIGYSGPRRATLETLEALHALHPAAIPFENLNPLLGWPVALDIASLQAKMVAGGRGGWCFEQNGLFRAALESIGFSIASLAARVLWNAPPGAPIGSRSHMLLRVDLDARTYLIDVGFGGNSIAAPLKLEPDVLQSQFGETYRLLRLDGGYLLEVSLPDGWKPMYRFTLEPAFQSDYEVSNWFLCNHPNSFFRQLLIAARITPGARYTLRNNALAIRGKQGTEKRTLTDAEALRECLERDFAIRLPDAPELEAMLERVSNTPAEVAV
jgi:N-hydroxyarylamine O-acetyltransferase